MYITEPAAFSTQHFTEYTFAIDLIILIYCITLVYETYTKSIQGSGRWKTALAWGREPVVKVWTSEQCKNKDPTRYNA